jgi:hypothetical protein
MVAMVELTYPEEEELGTRSSEFGSVPASRSPATLMDWLLTIKAKIVSRVLISATIYSAARCAARGQSRPPVRVGLPICVRGTRRS